MSALPDVRAVSISTAGYEDGLGRRSVRFDREVGGMLECLRLRPELRAFEATLRERAEAVGRLDDERFVPVHGFEDSPHGLTVVSELVPGERLVDVIEARQKDGAPVFGIDAALGLLLQTLPALSVLHAASLSHGLLSPGRVIVTPVSQIVLLDAIYAPAVERLNLNRRALWASLGVLASPVAGINRLDRQSDVLQACLCALVLATGRHIATGESAALGPLVQDAVEVAEIRGGAEFAVRVRQFFTATLPVSGRRPMIATDDAVFEARTLAALIGEEGCHAALGELTRMEAARPPAAGASSPEPKLVIVAATKAAVIEPTGVEDAPPAPMVAPPPPPERVVASTVAPPPMPPPIAPLPDPAVAAAPAPPPPLPVVAAAPAPPPPIVAAPPAPPVFVPPPPAPPIPMPVFAPAPEPPPLATTPLVTFTPTPRPVPLPPAAAAAPPPIGIAVVQPAPLRVRHEPPPGYAPAHPEPHAPVRGVLFADRADERPSRFPWKLAAAALVVLGIGIPAGRAYLAGEPPAAAVEDAPAAAAAAAAPVAAPKPVETGGLTIESQPAGANVAIDGRDAGVTPLTVDALTPGRHSIAISTPTATVKRTVRVEAGRIITLDVPLYPGWVAVFSPIALDVATGGRTIGNTDTGKIMLPPGQHDLTLSNRKLGYSETRSVEIHSGEERPLNVEPKSTVNVNAHPWAEVWVDGKKAGDTPIANLKVLLGTRVFLFKHPQFGERRITMTITSKPAAISVDLTRPE